MKKITLKITALALSVLCLSACGAKKIDVASVSDGILNGVTFSEALQPTPDKIALKRLGLNAEDVKNCIAYTSTNAVVDEFAVIEAANVSNVEAAIQNHIATQISTYESYAPNEVSKLKDAVVDTVGDYVIYVVSPDNNSAQNAVKKLIK